MRIIDADALMPLFMKKANTMKDRHGVKLGEEWLLNYNDIKDVIDNAPTVTIKEWKKEMPIYIKDAMLEALRPTGEWIGTDGEYQCNKCYEKRWYRSNYCPQCGAMMKEAENDEP